MKGATLSGFAGSVGLGTNRIDCCFRNTVDLATDPCVRPMFEGVFCPGRC